MTDDQEMKLECLKVAQDLGLSATETIEVAKRYYDFLGGELNIRKHPPPQLQTGHNGIVETTCRSKRETLPVSG